MEQGDVQTICRSVQTDIVQPFFFIFYNNHFAGLFFFFLKLACTVEWDKHLVSISCEEMHSEKVVTGVHF